MKLVAALSMMALACPVPSAFAQTRPRFSMPQLCNAMSTSTLCKLANSRRQPATFPAEFQGAWASSSSGCRNTRQPDDVIEGGGIVIKPTEINGYEMGATLVRVISSAPGAITFSGRESSEAGDEGVKTITMRVSGSTLSYKTNGTGSGNYMRCLANNHSIMPQPAARTQTTNSASSEIQQEYPRQGKCRLTINSKTYINGPCRYSSDNDGSFNIITPSGSYFVMVEVDGSTAPRAFFNGEAFAEKALMDIGPLKRRGACWTNKDAEVCLWA